ncbi:unnamed protein product [Somion occarium]|uniref:Halogenase n=1 Tax=Somion occarium TaxID=3059160 RepID=A0ABP1DLQ3_9APHY
MSSPVVEPHDNLQTNPELPPSQTRILVIGGGPSGSYAATLLAREGFDVTLLERDQFPRYHIGESLLQSIPRYLSFIDAQEVIKAKGFKIKPGAAVKLNQYKRESYTDFTPSNPANVTWNVVRSEFDDALLRHAAACGVHVFENTKVNSLQFDDPSNPERPTSAQWKIKDGAEGSTKFEWLVDASGRAGVMSTQYLRNRIFNLNLKNVACWGYWKGGASYAAGTPHEDAPWFEALTDESGWVWHIPLHDGTVSVGFVMSETSSIAKKSAMRERTGSVTLVDHYLDQMQLAPGLQKLLEKAELVSSIKAAGDYSYSAHQYAGSGYRLVGDAGAFIDPFFSSGVHLAFTSEEEAVSFHNLKFGTAYTRFLIIVLGVYGRIRAQEAPALEMIDEEGFHRAFQWLRPMLRGDADVGLEKVTEIAIQKAMLLSSAVFAPTSPTMHAEVAQRLDPDLTNMEAPVLLPEDIERMVGTEDEDAFHVVSKINARKAVHSELDANSDRFAQEAFEGFSPSLGRGELGLRRQTQEVPSVV